MSSWKYQRKSVLVQLASELGIETQDSDTNKALVKKIAEASDYDEELTNAFAERIKTDLEIAEEREIKRRERQREQEFELQKLKISCSLENESVRSESGVASSDNRKRVNLKDLVPKFDIKSLDATLFFALFEKQAKRYEINENEWVSQLIPLLPCDVIDLIIREPVELSDDYPHVKKLLLKRFRVSSAALKSKFEEHNRKFGSLWVDLVYDLRSYLDNYLDSLGIKEFGQLKELLVLEQIKKRVDWETKMHFVDRWEEFKQAADLALKLDAFENAKRSMKKSDAKNWEKRVPYGDKFFGIKNKDRKGNREANADEKGKTEVAKPVGSPKKSADNDFDKRKPMACFECGGPHLRRNCVIWKNKNAEAVNNLGRANDLPVCFEPYVSQIRVNGITRTCLRDTGATIDVCSRNWISLSDFTGEYVDILQPFDHSCKSLPLAKITLEADFGRVITKAAVKPSDLESGPYLIGNKTAQLIQEAKKGPELINAVTRSQRKRIRDLEEETGIEPLNKPVQNVTDPPVPEAEPNPIDGPHAEVEGSFELPAAQRGEFEAISKISPGELLEAQRACENLKPLWGKVSDSGEFRVLNGKLCRVNTDSRGEERIQLCIPLMYRERLKNIVHEDVSGHLGTTKTKDRLIRNFFWPNCYQDIEDYVRSCHSCQIIGKSRDKKKAPLRLVPIISEVFSKINIDATGPLPVSDKGNKYLITAICLASRYPDAVPTVDLTSDSVINALLIIFSRMGFPKEIQSDLGTSFTSYLTTAFFDRFGIKVSHSSVMHPESNLIERFHSSIKRVLKVLSHENGNDWEKNLYPALFALRTVTQESTGFSPAELVHGKNLRTPLTLIYENWIEAENTDPSIVEYIFEITNRLKKWHEISEANQKDKQLKRKTWYDRKAVNRVFNVGDQVLVLATSKPNKMAANWRGPGVITGKISDTNYTVDLPGKKDNLSIYHVNLLKPYVKRVELVNFLIEEDMEEVEREAEIPYPTADPNQFDLAGMVGESGLEERVTPEQLDRLRRLLLKHRDVFSSDPGLTSLVEMDIVLTSDVPVRSRPYRMSQRQTDILRDEINRMLRLGVIEIGQSEFSSPMILIETPGKDPRPCIDYRRLNAITRLESFPIPNIEEVVERVCAAPFITVMDLAKGYFQIPLTERARRYAAFVTPFGGYIPRRSMFGLLNSGFYFCKLMAVVLGELERISSPYIDDIATHSLTWDEHLNDLDTVLGKVGDAGLKVKPSKCKFAQSQVHFLGHVVGSGKRSPSEAKVRALLDFPTPSTKTQIRSFLGICGYYAKYVRNYSIIAAPLTDALKGKKRRESVEWTEACEEAFRTLKCHLTKYPVLYAPDFNLRFYIQTDASLNGAGMVLSQRFGDDEHPIVYLSKKFTRAERNYSTVERELAAIVYGIKKLHYYLDGREFTVESDHNPLCFLKSMMGTNARLTRWALYLQQYCFEVKHRPGKKHGNADALSRTE